MVIGFVNALAILIFAAQLPELNPATERGGLARVSDDGSGFGDYLWFSAFAEDWQDSVANGVHPVAMAIGLDIRNVGDMGDLF